MSILFSANTVNKEVNVVYLLVAVNVLVSLSLKVHIENVGISYI